MTQGPRWPRSPPAPSASSSLACEDESTCQNPASNVSKDRSCDEKSRAPRIYVIIRDGIPTGQRIEMVFSKLKTLSRKADARSIEASWRRAGTVHRTSAQVSSATPVAHRAKDVAMDRRYTHLNSEESGVILPEHRRWVSLREIGVLLGRASSSIRRELRRGRPNAKSYCPRRKVTGST
jgi:hypothetical protein